jgi:hemerythrin
MSESYFKWDEKKLSTHVDSMDKEHKKLIEMMNRLHQRYHANAPVEELKKIMNELGNWTETHFAHEEDFFDQLPYTQATAHKLIHKGLLTKFSRYNKEFQRKGKLPEDFFIFLKSWLTAHIAGIDTKYGAIANQKAG